MDTVRMPEGTKVRKRTRIGLKIGCAAALMQMLSVVLAVSICVYMFRELVTEMQGDRCTTGTDMLAYELERIPEGGDINQMLDGLKSRTGCEFTIFEGDTRAYSTMSLNGERVVGTKLSDELIEIVLRQGKNYMGEAEIMGESYLCSYVPVKGEDGQASGLIFAGISMTKAREGAKHVITLAGVVSTATILICVILMAAYLKKRVSAPMAEITRVASQLERGDLGLANGREIRVSVRSGDEIGMLGRIFEDTIHRLRSYIGEISDVLGAIASGNLTRTASQDYMGDFQSIKKSLDTIQSGLNRTIGQIAISAGQVSDESDQVSGSVQALAQGATEQASSVQQISATITDISENARQTADAAAEAGEFVDQAGARLGISIDYVKELNVAMENISGTSKEISTIIATIEDIAFQINILSLNAAVEASRAGEAGKGFAVVAEEVRNLAARSDEAAKATRDLIVSSIKAVTEGSQAVERVNESLAQTGQIASKVTDRMSIVVDAVEKQTQALSQVSEGVEQIAAVVQNNSATSEECSAASEELSDQAGLLKNLTSSFRL